MNLRVELWDSNEWKEVYSVDMLEKINKGDYADDVINDWNNAISDFVIKCTLFEGKKFQITGPYWFVDSSVNTIDNKQEE